MQSFSLSEFLVHFVAETITKPENISITPTWSDFLLMQVFSFTALKNVYYAFHSMLISFIV